MQSFPTMVSRFCCELIKHSCLNQICEAKTCLAYKGQFPIVYYEQRRSSIMNNVSHLLRPKPVAYYDQRQPSIMTKVFLYSFIFRTPYSE